MVSGLELALESEGGSPSEQAVKLKAADAINRKLNVD
jgi:hypothetical protein